MLTNTVPILVVVFGALSLSSALKLPHYIKACSQNDPNLNDCAKRNAPPAIPFLLKGDAKYHIPVLNPLKVPEIILDTNGNLKIKLTDNTVNGIEETELKDINIDLKKRHVQITLLIPTLNIIGNYEINGRILILPITGNGPANITFQQSLFTYDIDYDLIDKKGEQYADITKSSVQFASKKSRFRLDNLFNGDKALSDQMNIFLEENWQEVEKELSPAISEAMRVIITAIIRGVLDRVPYNEIFIKEA